MDQWASAVMENLPAHANVLPELLLSMLGFPGDVFIFVRGESDRDQLELSGLVDWLSTADKELVLGLSYLGKQYTDILACIEKAGVVPSLYFGALANGVSELLDVYRLAVLQIEQHLIKAPTTPLLTLHQYLADFKVLLPDLRQLLHNVRECQLSGSQIMHVLAAKAGSGIPAVQSCSQRLLWHCYQVMFKQLESWLVHGMLIDAADEFFVQPVAGAKAGVKGPSRLSLSPLWQGAGPAKTPKDWDPLEWHAGFEVRITALPPGVSLSTAESVLFIGKAVRVLKQPMAAGRGAAANQALSASSEVIKFCDVIQKLQDDDTFRGQQALTGCYMAKWQLPLQECRAAEFDKLIEEMRSCVASLLWNLVLHQSDLMGKLTSMRNYFLLGRGDFYQQFLDEAQALFNAPPRSTTAEADAALLFQQASLKSTAEADPYFPQWHLRWSEKAITSAAEATVDASFTQSKPLWHPTQTSTVTIPGLDTWDGIFLESSVDWPLQLLFPPEILSKYGAVWQYLFRLRRVQLALQDAWATLQALQHPSATLADNTPKLSHQMRVQLWHLRQRMTHFVLNLQMYTQVDVIDNRFRQLSDQVREAQDFLGADAAHRLYVDSLLTQTFLDLKQLMHIVEQLFIACMRLCTLVQELDKGRSSEDDILAQLKDIAAAFRTRFSLLMTLLQSNKLQSASRAPAVRQLLLRLNFNDFNTKVALSAALSPY